MSIQHTAYSIHSSVNYLCLFFVGILVSHNFQNLSATFRSVIASLLLHAASLLHCAGIVISRLATLLYSGAKFINGSAILRNHSANMLNAVATLRSGSANLLSRSGNVFSFKKPIKQTFTLKPHLKYGNIY